MQRNIGSHLFFDADNPSSVCSCITAARENARIARTSLTTQVGDAINTAFQEMRKLERVPRSETDLARMTDWTTRTTALVRGAIEATQLRRGGYVFLNLGCYLDRADSTARLLDVKNYVLFPKVEYVGFGLDNHQWTTLLRPMSSHRAFHWAYGDDVTTPKIAHFVILNRDCPRSLITCVEGMVGHLDNLGQRYNRPINAQPRPCVA